MGFSIADEAHAISDDEAVERVRLGDTELYELIMRRHNQRLYRVVRSILRDDAESEDAMQAAYVHAYEHLSQYAARAQFSTWLTRIAINEAFARLRRRKRVEAALGGQCKDGSSMSQVESNSPGPERETYHLELRSVLESAIDGLPEGYRTVFVLRAVEELSVADTAACLDVGLEAVKTRFHRARKMLRDDLERQLGIAAKTAFPFHLSRCNTVVDGVFRKLGG